MGALADFIRREFGDAPRAPKIEKGESLAAIPASPAIPHVLNSKNSKNSSPPLANSGLPSPTAPVVVEGLARRVSIEALLGDMARENEARRDWWRQSVEGWREGRLELRSVISGETKIIFLRTPGRA
jgi:hypothetical protein